MALQVISCLPRGSSNDESGPRRVDAVREGGAIPHSPHDHKSIKLWAQS